VKSAYCAAPPYPQFHTVRLSTDKEKDKYGGKCKAVRVLNQSLSNEEEKPSGDKASSFLTSTIESGECSASGSSRFSLAHV
jgi:hypothetical protein